VFARKAERGSSAFEMSEEITSSEKPPLAPATPFQGASDAKDDANLRKNKSLLAICKKFVYDYFCCFFILFNPFRFLEFYPLDLQTGTSMDIPLEVLADKLNLSRRRLYDIINVMESLQMAVKVTKNVYRWYGLRNVKKLLNQLKQLSDQDRLQELVFFSSKNHHKLLNHSINIYFLYSKVNFYSCN